MNRKLTKMFRPTLEALETRCLMATGLSASLANRTLTINGSEAADVIQVSEMNQRISITDTLIRVGKQKVASVNTRQVAQIVINGKGGNDVINLFQDVTDALSRPARILGGNGDDQIWGGMGNDKIYGGNGNDFLCGMDGSDFLFGQAGNDQLYGGVGGRDKLEGGPGTNILDGVAGQVHAYSTDALDSHPDQGTPPVPQFSGSLYPTYLDVAIGPNDTTIKLGGTDTGAGNVPFLIQIDGEILRVTQVVDNATWVVDRGTNGTTRQSHAAGAFITSANVVDQGGQGGTGGTGGTGGQGGNGGQGETGGQNGQNYKPVPPAIISPIGTAGSITPTFTWTPVAGALRYEIFVADPTASKVLNPTDVTGTSWTASAALVSGTTYTWWVRAIVDDGYDDPWSEPKTFQVTGSSAGSAPFAPTSLAYQQLNKTDIILSWSNVANETGYALQYWDGKGWTEFARTGADVTSTTVTGAIGLYFRVSAYNGFGANVSKYIVAADGGGGTLGGTTGGATGLTSAPTGLTWSPTNSTDGKLSWSNVDGETGYVIEYWTGSGWAQFASTPTDVTRLDVKSGAGAYLRVGATTSGKTVYSDYILASGQGSGNTGGTVTAPEAPSQLRWSPIAGNHGTLFWSNVTGETGYVVEYWNGSAWSQFATTSVDVNSLYVTDGAGRHLRVGAYNGVGTTYSEYITTAQGTGGTTGGTNSGNSAAPTAPTQLTWATSVGNDGNLSWTNATGETSYVIEYWNGAAWIQFASTGADITTLYITSAVGNYFRVGAKNSFGTTYSDYVLASN